jgi:GTP-binding protein LepA
MTDVPLDRIRNFSIIAHIDHGKSTLADRLIQTTGTVALRDMKEQLLDNMELERERGITIKAQTVRLTYPAKDGKTYTLNLMDTPGHVDFAYEVSRSLAACEGSLLVVDASQGVEAQTLANVTRRSTPGTRSSRCSTRSTCRRPSRSRVRQQIEDVIGLPADDAVEISAKTGLNIEGVLEALVQRLPPPKGDADAPLKALLVDSWYDPYLGVVILVRVKDGRLRKGPAHPHDGQRPRHTVEQVGVFSPKMVPVESLGPGEMGYVTAAIKTVADTNVGDTITDDRNPATGAAAGLQAQHPRGLVRPLPVDADDFEKLREIPGKLRLNDAASTTRRRPPPRSASATAAASSACCTRDRAGAAVARVRPRPDRDRAQRGLQDPQDERRGDELHNPADMPDGSVIDSIAEPWIKATIMVPDDYLGPVLTLCNERRGQQAELTYVGNRAMAVYRLPLNEVVFDFYDRLKSISRGYASFDYVVDGYQAGDLVKISILVNAEPVDALSFMAHRSQADRRGRQICEKLKELIPRQLFKIPIQAAIGGRVIARETISAMSKDVTAKCYGGDISRKRKLLDKQKEGKKRMRQFGKVEIPQSAFIAALKMDA